MYIRIHIFNFKKTKEEKRISAENLTGYDDIVCEFALCTFNLLDRVANFVWLFIGIQVVYVQQKKSQYLLYYSNIWSTEADTRGVL